MPWDPLGRCPLPSCRPGKCTELETDKHGWWMDRDENLGKHTNHSWNTDHIWFSEITKVCERRSAENSKPNSKRTFLESLHVSLLLFMSFARQRHNFEQLHLLHLSGSFGSSLLTFRDAKRPRPVHASWSLNSLRHKPLGLSSKEVPKENMIEIEVKHQNDDDNEKKYHV